MTFIKVYFTFGLSNLTIMKTRFLFPHRWRVTGYVLFSLGLIFYIISNYTQKEFLVWHHFRATQDGGYSIDECFDNEIQLFLVTLGLLLAAFTKEKTEDEQIMQLRLDSLQWAVYVNYAIFFVIIFTCYSLDFFAGAMYNIFTLLVFFIVRFRWAIYKINRAAGKEVEVA